MAFTLQSVAGIMRCTEFIQSVCSSICEQKPCVMEGDSASSVSYLGDMAHVDITYRRLAALSHAAHTP